MDSIRKGNSTFGYSYYAIVLSIILFSGSVYGQEGSYASDDLKKLSIEELMNIEVTTVSRRAEKLTETASAIQVLTREDILRSGATSLPEALRLAQNLQMARLNSYGWLISARGFNNVFANKLLVMIDGRTVYTPLFAGVYWDVQSVLLEDIDRIEIISGPGGTLWGSNAVNGVINIITRSAAESQGLYVSGAAGNFMKDFLAARYGGKIAEKLSYRVYAQHFDRNRTSVSDGSYNRDRWYLSQAGARMDWNDEKKDALSFQGNVYWGLEKTSEGLPGNPMPSSFDGQNAMVRWSHSINDGSDFIVQAYYDRTWRRDPPSTFSDELDTYDIDIQHRFSAGKVNDILWGVGYRRMNDKSQHSTPIVGFVPERRNMDLFSAFVQDEITVLPNVFKATIGSKILHNVFTGIEIQPSARLTLTPWSNHTLWSAVSRAVRTPSRIDVDYKLPTYEVPEGSLYIAGGPNFVSEKVIAYEAGYRVQPLFNLSLSLATFYNRYQDLYSVEPLPGTLRYEIQNGLEGESFGSEFSFIFTPVNSWRLRGGYTFFHKSIWNKPGHSYDASNTGTDPSHQFLIQSMLDLPAHFKFDVTLRYVDDLPGSPLAGLAAIPSYYNMNARISWTYKPIEFSIVGQDILNAYNTEYGAQNPPLGFNRIPRSVFCQLIFRY